MTSELDEKMDQNQATIYQIRLKGHLGSQWAEWFEGLTVTLEENGDTLLTGPVVDQSTLYGLLKKARDLGLTLLSVNCTGPCEADELEGKSPIPTQESSPEITGKEDE